MLTRAESRADSCWIVWLADVWWTSSQRQVFKEEEMERGAGGGMEGGGGYRRNVTQSGSVNINTNKEKRDRERKTRMSTWQNKRKHNHGIISTSKHVYCYFVWRLNKDPSRLQYLRQHSETCKATMLLTDLKTKFDQTKWERLPVFHLKTPLHPHTSLCCTVTSIIYNDRIVTALYDVPECCYGPQWLV